MTTIASIKKKLKDCYDLELREFVIAEKSACVFFLSTLVDNALISSSIIEPLFKNLKKVNKSNIIENLYSKFISCGTSVIRLKNKNVYEEIMCGNAVIVIDGEPEILSCAVQGYEKRAIVEPPTASVLKGPREGFIEDISTNISLIRRRIKSSDLVIKKYEIGRISKSAVAVIYMKDIADEKIVNQVTAKLKDIDIDGILDSYYIKELLGSSGSKLFTQFGDTERPDVAVSKIYEGRIAIVVDGSPFAITLPYFLMEDLQNADDYYMHPTRATVVRIIRLLGLFLSITLPGLYVAMQSFHSRVLPINFIMSLLSSVESLAFPPLIEILFVLFLFEILTEASIRMPKHLGLALSIIGALVLGDTAVQAGIISPPAVMIVAISGISLHIVPNQLGTSTILRTIFTIIGGVSGFYGIIIGTIFLVGFLASIDNYGVGYLAPYAPSIENDKKDAILKKGLKEMDTRPMSYTQHNKVRMSNGKTIK
ncbi:MAG: spore germination protein [Clostridia bacterium]